MNLGRLRTGATALPQRGFALIAMLALAALITAFLIAIGLNRSQAELMSEREDRNMNALRQAKAALISYAASEEWQLYKGQTHNQPGGLPCPDTDLDTVPADTGVSSGICSGAAGRVGRLPFATIGSEDLRDASGERLWYAVSSNFYKTRNNVINSDTQGLLTVTGSAPAVNVVAIVFAPGPAVQDPLLPAQIQDRSVATNYNRIASYLEGYTAAGSDYTFTSSTLQTATFNDRLLVITQAELMAAVEPVVAARIERDVKPYLIAYASASQWGRFPFPVKWDFPDPGSSGSGTLRSPMLFVGDSSLSYGLLPVSGVAVSAASNASPIVVTTYSPHMLSSGDIIWISGTLGNTAANGKWTVTVVDSTHFQLNGSTGNGSYTSGGTVTPSYPWSAWSVAKTGGSGIIDSDSCSTVSMPFPGLQCIFQAHPDVCGPDNCIASLSFRIQSQAGSNNAGRTFATLPNKSDVSTLLDGVGSTFLSDSVAGSLASNGTGTATYTATLPFNCTNTCNPSYNITVTIPDVVSSRITSASPLPPPAPYADWFVANEWYRQTYYAVANDLLPGPARNGNCGANPPCLTVNNLPAKFTASNDKQVILILAGRTLNGSARPSGTWSNYMEGANQTATVTNIYEHRTGSPTSINDRVVVVAP